MFILPVYEFVFLLFFIIISLVFFVAFDESVAAGRIGIGVVSSMCTRECESNEKW